MASVTRCTDGLFRISAVCSLWVIINASTGCPVWWSARVGLGTNPLPPVYSRPDQSSWDTRVAAASLRWWHADFWLLRVLMTSGCGCGPTGCSLSLHLERGTAFRSLLRHQRPLWFSKSFLRQFYLLAPSHHSNTFLRFILSPCFILRFYVFSIMFSVYNGFMYRALAVLTLRHVNLIRFYITLQYAAPQDADQRKGVLLSTLDSGRILSQSRILIDWLVALRHISMHRKMPKKIWTLNQCWRCWPFGGSSVCI